MNQQTPYAPRWARILGRSGTLIGIVAVLGALTGAIFGALSTQTFTSIRTLDVTSSTCASEGAICSGPAFSSEQTTTVVTIMATARTADQALVLTGNRAANYMIAASSLDYVGGISSVAFGPSTLQANGTAQGKLLLGDVLLGLVCGTLVGAVAALAGSRTTIDPLGADNQWQRAAERAGLIRDWSADGATNLGAFGSER